MTDETVNDASPAAPDWPLRPWLLAGLLGLAGLLIHLVTGGNDQVPWQMAAAAFLFFGAIAAAFTLERDRWKGAGGLRASPSALVMAGLAWRAVRYGENLPDEQYGFAAGVVATALALPLFQAGLPPQAPLRHLLRRAPYHVWTDAISAAGRARLHRAVVAGARADERAVPPAQDRSPARPDGRRRFGWTFSGLAAGAALGTLRNQLKVLGTMQTVVLLVLSLLAVPLALGLVVFLLATAAYGPASAVGRDAQRHAGAARLRGRRLGAGQRDRPLRRRGDEPARGSCASPRWCWRR